MNGNVELQIYDIYPCTLRGPLFPDRLLFSEFLSFAALSIHLLTSLAVIEVSRLLAQRLGVTVLWADGKMSLGHLYRYTHSDNSAHGVFYL